MDLQSKCLTPANCSSMSTLEECNNFLVDSRSAFCASCTFSSSPEKQVWRRGTGNVITENEEMKKHSLAIFLASEQKSEGNKTMRRVKTETYDRLLYYMKVTGVVVLVAQYIDMPCAVC